MGVDAGTHGVRVGIADETGTFVAMSEVEHPTEYPVAGRAEQNAEHWWVGFKEALRNCLNTMTEEQRKNIVVMRFLRNGCSRKFSGLKKIKKTFIIEVIKS